MLHQCWKDSVTNEDHARIDHVYRHKQSQDTSRVAHSTPPSRSLGSESKETIESVRFGGCVSVRYCLRRLRGGRLIGIVQDLNSHLVTELLHVRLRKLLALAQLCDPSVYFLFHYLLVRCREKLE